MRRRDTLLIVLHRPGIEAVHAQAAQVAADVAQLCAEVAALWADVAQLREHNSSLVFEFLTKVCQSRLGRRLSMPRLRSWRLMWPLRAEVAALRKRGNSLERTLARPSNDVSAWSLH